MLVSLCSCIYLIVFVYRKRHLGVSHWEHDRLSELVAIPVSDFAGIFALLVARMSYGRYWIVISLNTLEPEQDQGEDEEGAWV